MSRKQGTPRSGDATDRDSRQSPTTFPHELQRWIEGDAK